MTELKAILVTTAKNEAPYFLEWVAHHQELGFTDIVVFQNDSDDLTHETLSLLRKIGAIRYLYNRGAKGQQQAHAYARAAELAPYQHSTWAMALNMDDFLVVKTGNGTLSDLIRALPEVDCIHLNRRNFGNSGYETLTEQLVTERFCMADHPLGAPDQFSAFKCLFRSARFQRPGVHHPHRPTAPEPVRHTNGSGLPPDAYLRKDTTSTDPLGSRYAQINHYGTRDLASFMLNAENPDIGQSDWLRQNTNFAIDDSMQPWLARLKARMGALDAASGGRLMDLREAAMFLHMARYYTLLQAPQMRAFRQFCKTHPNAADQHKPKGKHLSQTAPTQTVTPKSRARPVGKTTRPPTVTATT
ncbi:glycosyltransferase family 2 protein [Pseudorhodobacter sp.]|uniref:glycosyltransferase family 2 protein n=1 Tax=Pseudorhodobacter sp. TaxID=1934400 RepID=UPI002AFE5F2F|nr:glycosyltransferase family 2 protein [Pseudorhodobacter sp.]